MFKKKMVNSINWGLVAALAVALGFAFNNWVIGIAVAIPIGWAMSRAHQDGAHKDTTQDEK